MACFACSPFRPICLPPPKNLHPARLRSTQLIHLRAPRPAPAMRWRSAHLFQSKLPDREKTRCRPRNANRQALLRQRSGPVTKEQDKRASPSSSHPETEFAEPADPRQQVQSHAFYQTTPRLGQGRCQPASHTPESCLVQMSPQAASNSHLLQAQRSAESNT